MQQEIFAHSILSNATPLNNCDVSINGHVRECFYFAARLRPFDLKFVDLRADADADYFSCIVTR